MFLIAVEGFPGCSVVKNPPANAGDTGSIPGSERSPGVGISSPFQYSCLENPMDRGAWRATVCGVTQRRTGLSDCACSTSSDGLLRCVTIFLMLGTEVERLKHGISFWFKPELTFQTIIGYLPFFFFLFVVRVMVTVGCHHRLNGLEFG